MKARDVRLCLISIPWLSRLLCRAVLLIAFCVSLAGIARAESTPGVVFSRVSCTFSTPFVLTLQAAGTNVTIRYTVDGSLPTNTSPAYLAPITVTNSIQVRASAFAPGFDPSPPHSESFILLNTNVLGFTSDLPLLIIHCLGKGAPTDSRQTFAQLAFFEPVQGVTSLTNAPTLATRSGIRIRGSSTDGLPKASYAVELWDDYNQDQKHPVLGLPSESDWVLYAPDSFEPVLIHNPFVHQMSRDMGRYSSRTRFVEVFLNKSTGPIASNSYNGIYVLEEKIKIGSHRVAIDKLKVEDTNAPAVTGGYLLKIDRLDPGDSGFSGAGQTIAYVDPKESTIKLPEWDAQEQYIKSYFANFGRALNGTNWRDPVNGYAAWIDVDSWIDYHVLEVLSGNVDALVLSTYFYKPRSEKIVFGPHWDFDRSLGSTDGRDANPRMWNTGPFFTGWWARLFTDPDFWQKWIDRYQELRGNIFSREHINGLVDQLADEVRLAEPREYQRWRVALRGGSYQSEVDRMKAWLSNRVDFIDKQLVQPPVFSAPSGRVTAGYTVTLTGPANATIYYTLDGSDPRASGGSVTSAARVYSGPITIDRDVRIVPRARNFATRQTGGPPISSPWSRPAAATFTLRPPPLLVTEIMFHPESSSSSKSSDLEFIELKNVGGEMLDLNGYRLTNALTFEFSKTNALITTLGAGERLLLVRNLSAFQQRYPGMTNVAGQYSGALSNGGARLTMLGPLQEVVFDFTYAPGWQPLADGLGFSLVVADESVSPVDLGVAANWRLSAALGGSPGSSDPPAPHLPRVLVNELLPYPGPPAKDEVELFNSESADVDISGWYLTDNFQQPKKYRLPAQTTVVAKGYLVIRDFGPDLAFRKLGEDVYLFSADAAGNLTGWAHGFTYSPAELGVSFGRHVTSAGVEKFVAQVTPTLGEPNAGPRVGPIIINEIQATPALAVSGNFSFGEYVELWNPTQTEVPLFDPAHPANTWRLRGGVDYEFPPNVVLPPDGYLVVVGFNPKTDATGLAQFKSLYGIDGLTPLLGPWSGHLAAGGDTVQLIKPGEPTIDLASGTTIVPEVLVEAVNFSADALWPASAGGDSLSLQRQQANTFADDPASWSRAWPTPGDRDSDGDGLPDRWEIAHGLNPNSASGPDGAGGDPDHDGLTNLQEFRTGTDPQDPTSALGVQSALIAQGTVQLQFQTTPGRSYTLEGTDSLSPASWQVLQQFQASTGSQSVTIFPSAKIPQRFYRVHTP